MRLYTVHLRRHGLDPDRDLVLVKEGFSWPAFFFSFLWALWCGLWWVALALLGVGLALGLLGALLGLDEISQAVVSLGWAAATGYLANDLKRWTLGRRGFVDQGVVSGSGLDAAERRYVESRPDLAAEWVTEAGPWE